MTNDSTITSYQDVGVSMPVLPPTINAEKFESESEGALARRYGGHMRTEQEPVFEYTRDPALLHQYRLIYEQEFRSIHNAQRYKSVVDEHDRKSHFLVIRVGNLCVGGARLTVRTPRQPLLLPVESNDFRIESHFPDLKQKEKTYAQVGRICVLPEFRGGDLTCRMFWHINRKAAALGVATVFATAPIFNARMIRKYCLSLGLKSAKIHFAIDVPPYPMCEEIKMYFMSIGVDKSVGDGDERDFAVPPSAKEKKYVLESE